MIHDSAATFYGGYDQTGVGRLPTLRLPRVQFAIAVASVALILLLASDVAAIGSEPAIVQVSSVDWFAGNISLGNSSGFRVVGSQTFHLTETCELFCFNFRGATVSSPFELLRFTVTDVPIQYANLTIRAPGSSYDGPLTITLEVGLGGSNAQRYLQIA